MIKEDLHLRILLLVPCNFYYFRNNLKQGQKNKIIRLILCNTAFWGIELEMAKRVEVKIMQNCMIS